MKQCLFEPCTFDSFSNGYCQRHQYLRTDDKWLNKERNKAVEPLLPIRRYKLPTENKQGFKTTKSTLKESFGFSSQIEMFNQIWSDREHICQISGSNLDLVPKSRYVWMFAHILNKKNYPFFKLNPLNILLVHPDIHYCVDNFTTDMILKHRDYDFGKWMNLVLEMKQQYKQFLLDNLL